MKKSNIKSYCLLFMAALLPRLICCLQMMPVRTVSDEVATISTAAFLAGLDWSKVVSNAGYYGGGFTACLAFLFKLTDNPIWIYRGALVICSVVQSATALIAYHLMKKYFKITNRWLLFWGALSCSFMVVTRTNIVYNEHMLIFLSWITAWILCALYQTEDKKIKRWETLLLMLVLSYALTVHIRASMLWIAVGITVLVYVLVSKKWLVSKSVCVVSAVLGYFFSQSFIRYIQNHIWAVESGEAVRNGAIQISVHVDLLDPLTWKTWISIILGQIYTIGVYSGTILLFAIVIFVPLILNTFFKRKQEEQPSLFFILGMVFLICIGGTIFAQSLTWLGGALEGFQEGYGTQVYSMKAITYVRYFGPYCGPLFMITLVYLYQKKAELKRYFMACAILFAGLQGYWLLVILPYIRNNSRCAEVFLAFVGQYNGDKLKPQLYIVGGIVITLFFIVMWILFYKNKKEIFMILLVLLLVWEYVGGSVLYDIHASKRSVSRAYGGYKLVQKMEKKNLELPEEIYVVDTRDITDHFNYYLYQFYLNRMTIIPGYPDKNCEDAVIFCNTKNEPKLLKRGAKCFKIDKNEYAYVIGEKWLDDIEKSGYKLVEQEKKDELEKSS